jgi:DNA-binding response OmpR family regulator
VAARWPESECAILVVDDDRAVRKLICSALRAEGFDVREAADGEAALAAVDAILPSLVVLDVRLPGISGYEVCSVLKRRHGDDLPVLFLSGARTEPQDRVAGLLLGADDYVVKPFAVDELLARIRNLLRRSGHASGRLGRLTAREREILTCLADGLGQKEVARQLAISPRTAARHIQNILAKLDVHSRAQAVALALREDPRLADGRRARR